MSKKKDIKIDDTKNSDNDYESEYDLDDQIDELDEDYEKSFDESDNCMVNEMIEEDESFLECFNRCVVMFFWATGICFRGVWRKYLLRKRFSINSSRRL